MFATITLIGVFAPTNPAMPGVQLDASWQYAMNEAVARHLSFGKDIVFTYGPYSSISTESYDPATNHLMVTGSLFLGVCYALVLSYLGNEANPFLLAGFLLYVAGFLHDREALIFSFPFLALAATIRFLEKDRAWQTIGWRAAEILMTVAAGAPLGLICLIKGTYMMVSGVTMFLIVASLFQHRRIDLLVTALISPILAMIVFWEISGQQLGMLPRFFASMLPIISGYSEAMATSLGSPIELIGYCVTAAAIVVAVARSGGMSLPSRLLIAIYAGLFLFLVFKSSFVRHDSHATIAGDSLVVAAVIVGMLYFDVSLMIALFLSVTMWLYIDGIHAVTSADTIRGRFRAVYFDTWTELQPGNTHQHTVDMEFARALANLRRKIPIPELQGTVDIYPAEQSAILASNNKWNPRPVIQSYAAYDPALAQINERHVRGDDAPDNVLFASEAIDGRLPALEDGPSWPALLDNYAMTGFQYGWAYFRKRPLIREASTYEVFQQDIDRTGERVAIAGTDARIFAEIDLRPTLLGRLVGLVYKEPELRMTLSLRNRRSVNYRVVASMMKSGFFLSPLVENTKDFTSFVTGNLYFFRQNAVESITITPVSGGGTLWEPTYTLELKTYERP